MLPNLGSFASLTEQISRRPRVAAFAIARAQRTGLITTAAAALLVLGAFLSLRDYIRGLSR
jgi:hypothetical protein